MSSPQVLHTRYTIRRRPLVDCKGWPARLLFPFPVWCRGRERVSDHPMRRIGPMRKQTRFGLGLLLAAVGSLALLASLHAGDGEPKKDDAKKDDARTEPSVKAKPLSD